jgi:hypothetical protein
VLRAYSPGAIPTFLVSGQLRIMPLMSAGVPNVAMTSTLAPTSSRANSGNRCGFPQRYSSNTSLPSERAQLLDIHPRVAVPLVSVRVRVAFEISIERMAPL